MLPAAPRLGLTSNIARAPRRNDSLKQSTALPFLQQRRVLRIAAAATASSTRHAPLLRSRLQWSHIVHHARAPTTMTGAGAQHQQARGHAGHSHSHGHGHHHHHDNTYLTSTNSSDPGVKITRVGLYVNLGMAVAKGAGGYVFNSQALTADALHALTDLISDITTLATISYSLRPVTSRFPTGYGKIESLGALGVSGLLLSGGLMIGLQALLALTQQLSPELAHTLSHLGIFGHGHSHSHGADVHLGPNINAAWLAGGSIVIKEWLYRATMKVAREKRSSILASNAYHHRVDSLTAIVALATILASRFLANAAWLDPVGGLVISSMIVQAGWGNTKNALLELADVGVDEEVTEGVRDAAGAAVGGFAGAEVKGVQGVKSGQNFLMEVEVAAPGDWSLKRTREVEVAVRERIGADVKGVRRVNVRFSEAGMEEPPFADMFLARQPGEDEKAEAPAKEHDHDHAHEDGEVAAQQEGAGGGARKRK